MLLVKLLTKLKIKSQWDEYRWFLMKDECNDAEIDLNWYQSFSNNI